MKLTKREQNILNDLSIVSLVIVGSKTLQKKKAAFNLVTKGLVKIQAIVNPYGYRYYMVRKNFPVGVIA